MNIQLETPVHVAAIHDITEAAFRSAPYSSGTEARIVGALRDVGALTLSVVALDGGEVIGHAAFSPVLIDGRACDWYGLGPVSVRPDRQGGGIGSAVVRDGLARLRAMQAAGCIVLGAPAYYGRFGFVLDPGLRYPGGPASHFQSQAFIPPAPTGEVAYHPAFDVA